MTPPSKRTGNIPSYVFPNSTVLVQTTLETFELQLHSLAIEQQGARTIHDSCKMTLSMQGYIDTYSAERAGDPTLQPWLDNILNLVLSIVYIF